MFGPVYLGPHSFTGWSHDSIHSRPDRFTCMSSCPHALDVPTRRCASVPGGLSYKREVDHYRSQYSNRAQTDGPATPEDAAAFNCFLHQLVCTQLNVFNDPLVLTNASNTKELWVSFVRNSEVATCSPRLLHTPLALASLLRHIATRLLLFLCPISLT